VVRRPSSVVLKQLLSLALAAALVLAAPSVSPSHPLHFERNLGQTDERVDFLSRGKGYTLFVTPQEAVLSLSGGPADGAPVKHDVVRLELLGANPEASVDGTDELPGVSHYFRGSDPERWRTDVPHFGKVRYSEVYPGVDLVYYGTEQRRLEFDFIVAPGADPGVVRLRFAGADSLRLDQDGNLILFTPGGQVVQQAPVTYQDINGTRHPVDSRYVLSALPSQSRPPPFVKGGRGGFPPSSQGGCREEGGPGGESPLPSAVSPIGPRRTTLLYSACPPMTTPIPSSSTLS